jgi:hypothetical protein
MAHSSPIWDKILLGVNDQLGVRTVINNTNVHHWKTLHFEDEAGCPDRVGYLRRIRNENEEDDLYGGGDFTGV